MKKVLTILTCFIFLAGLSNTFAQVGGQVPLNPNKIPQFVDPLPHFAGVRVDATTPATNNLIVKMVSHQQVAVSTGTKLATGTVGVTPGIGLANLWVYQISNDNGTSFTPKLWPAWTIEAKRGVPVNVTYSNELTVPGGNTDARYSDVGLIVDQTLHWADPTSLMFHQTVPPNAPLPLPGPYNGLVPTTVHLHGGEVPPQSDGGPDSWFTPGNTIVGHAFNGTAPTANPYLYPNTQEGATLWYHDHALGVTRLNVYAGLAGFYFLRETGEADIKLPGYSGATTAPVNDGMVQEVDRVTGLATGNPYLPEIEIVIQDRMFDDTGKLYFPNLPTNPTVHPTWTPEFVGDVITVNGKTWPYLSVAPRKYRFRFLNGSNARFYNLTFPNGGPTITQIGTDGGFLDSPVPLLNGPLLLAPGERADIIIDFTPFAPIIRPNGKLKISSFVLGNNARTPFPGGGTVQGATTGRIMEFVVNGTMVNGGDNSAANPILRPTPLVKLTDFLGTANADVITANGSLVNRQLTLNEVMGAGGPLEVLVNNTKWSGKYYSGNLNADGTPEMIGRADFLYSIDNTYYSETVQEGRTEVWQIINLTADAHPIHLHLVQFQLMSRQPFNVAGYNAVYNAAFLGGSLDPMTGLPYPAGVFMGGYGPPLDYNTGNPVALGGNPDITPFLQLPLRGANPNEMGWKDTFIMYPGEVTTVIARWTPTDAPANSPVASTGFAFNPDGGHGYVWHCHIIDHEDNEMMRPYNVMPNGAGRIFKQSGEVQVASVSDFSLDQNYPNPFNPSTVINFSVPKENTLVTLKIYNSLGEEVGTLINQVVPAGHHEVNFNARGLASGVYFYTLNAGNFIQSKKMVLLK